MPLALPALPTVRRAIAYLHETGAVRTVRSEVTIELLSVHREVPAWLRAPRARVPEWAKEHGLGVSERGRIPASVVEQYHAAGGR